MLSKLVSAWAHLEAYINVPIYRSVRRIDVILAIGFIVCVTWYYYTMGWQGALVGALMYILMMMVSLWLL